MEQKNPKLKVQKARLLNNTFQKGNKLKQILIIFLLSFSLQKMNPQALFDIKISDKSNFQINLYKNLTLKVKFPGRTSLCINKLKFEKASNFSYNIYRK